MRAHARVGTRNFVGLPSSVNCSSTVIKRIAAHLTPKRLAAFLNIGGVAVFAQTSGCGMSSPSEHLDVLRRALAGYARHPNWPACRSWAWDASATRPILGSVALHSMESLVAIDDWLQNP